MHTTPSLAARLRPLRSPLALLLLAGFACAQQSLGPPFNADNGGLEDGAVFFNISANSQITVAALDVHVDAQTPAGTAASLRIWFRPFAAPALGYSGNELNAGFWGTPSSTGSFVTEAQGTPSFVALDTPVLLNPGDYAVAIAATNFAHAYTTGTGSTLPGGGGIANTPGGFNQHATNGTLEMYFGSASNHPFTTSAPAGVFEPRVANVNLRYGLGSGLIAGLSRAYGNGCYDRPTTVYEDFLPGQIDLGGAANSTIRSIRLTPNGSGGYLTQQGSNLWSDQTGNISPGALPASAPLTAGDDTLQIVDLQTLAPGFVLDDVPGTVGPQRFLYVCSNGFVSTSPAVGNSYTPTAAELLAGEQRWAIAWSDYEPNAQGSVHFDYDGTNCFITWHDVPAWGNAGTSFVSFQMAMLPGGVVEYRWEQLDTVFGDHVVGYSTGGGATDPGMSDLSTVTGSTTIDTGPGSIPPMLSSDARAISNTTLQLTVGQLAPQAVFGAVLASLIDIPNGIDLNLVGVPASGCRAYIDITQNSSLGLNLTLGSPSFSQPFPIPPGLSGLPLFCQALVYQPGANTAGVVVSNGLELRVGDI
jgi:hypothetical protein